MLDPTQQGAIKAFTSRDFFRPQVFQPQQQTTLPGAGAPPLPPGFGSAPSAASSLTGAVGGLFGGGSAAGSYPVGGSMGAPFQLPTSLPGQSGGGLQLPGYMGDSLISGGYSGGTTMGSHPEAPSWLNSSPLSGRTYGRYEGQEGPPPVNERLWGRNDPSPNPHTPFSPGDVRLPPGGVYAPLTPQPVGQLPPIQVAPRPPPAYRPPGTTFSIGTGSNPGRSAPTYSTTGTGYRP